jgi:hypothetical protein
MCGGGLECLAGLLSGSCGRTLLAYKTRFCVEVPSGNEAWNFNAFMRPTGPVPITCYFPGATGELSSQTLTVSPNALVAELLGLLGREGLEPLDATRTTPIHATVPSGASRASVLFVGPADVARRALPEDTRRTIPVTIKTGTGRAFDVMLDLSEHGDYVIELKVLIQELHGCPPHLQRLFFKGKPLDNDYSPARV